MRASILAKVENCIEVVVLPLEDGGLGSRRSLTSFERFHLHWSVNTALVGLALETYHKKSHLSYTAKKAIERSSVFATPPIANVRHELSPGDTHRATSGDTKAFVGNENS